MRRRGPGETTPLRETVRAYGLTVVGFAVGAAIVALVLLRQIDRGLTWGVTR